MALQSKLFRGDAKLEAAAVSNPDHIVPGDRGPHVAKIQEAINTLDDADLDVNGIYDPATAAAVANFKRHQEPPILNYEGKIDDIVGIKTTAALDAGMVVREGNLHLDFKIEVTPLDVVFNFIGAPGASPQPAEEAMPKSFLPEYDPVVNDPLKAKRSLLRHRVNNRLLLRLAHGTTEIGSGRVAVFLNVMTSLADALSGPDPDNGDLLQLAKIFILGSSSGGRNAIDFVGFLSTKGFPPDFVASIDASFSQADTVDRPFSSTEPVEPIPVFTLSRITAVPGVVAPIRHNFFQRRGNHAKRVLNPFSSDNFTLLFTSKMAGGLEEIHGKVNAFNNHEVQVTGQFQSAQLGADDAFHEECDVLGRREAWKLIAAELRKV